MLPSLCSKMTEKLPVYSMYGLTGPPVALTRLENGSFYCDMPVPIPDQFFVFCKGEWTDENQYNVTLTYKGQEIQLGQISKSKSLLIVKWKRDEKMTRPASMLFQKETILAKLVVKINEGHTNDEEISDKQEMKSTQENKRRYYHNRIEEAPNEPSDKKQKTETTKENTRIRIPKSENLNSENNKLNLWPYDKEIDQNIVEHQESVRNEVSSTENVEKSKIIYRKMGKMDREQILPIVNGRDKKEKDATTSDLRLNSSEGETVKLDTTGIDLKTDLKPMADQNDQNLTDKDFVKVLSDTAKHCFTAEKTVTINEKKKPLVLIEVKVPETGEKSLNPASCKDVSTVVNTCALCKTTFTSTTNCVEHLIHAHGKDALKAEDIQILESWLKQNEQMGYKIDNDTGQELLTTERDKVGNKREVLPRSTTNEQLFKSGLFAYACTDKCNFPQHKMGYAGEKTYKVSVNENECNKSNRLNSLKITNISEDPHICDECGAIFQCYELNKFNIHKRKHKGESPYKCDICGNEFKLLSHLTMHKRIHTGEKPYKCDVCGKAFSKRCHLTTHTKIHTGEKPYVTRRAKRDLIGCVKNIDPSQSAQSAQPD